MFGVVLWSDKKRDRAVIWCEDHRNLAFFRKEPTDTVSAHRFEPGDLIEFELREEDDMRLAVDPCLIAPRQYSALVRELMQTTEAARQSTSLPTRERGEGGVIAFPLNAPADTHAHDVPPDQMRRRREAG